MKDTVRNICTPTDGFIHAVARHLRNAASVARDTIGPLSSTWIARHIDALEELAAYVEVTDVADQTVYGLWLLQSRTGGDSDEYRPTGEQQITVLSNIGRGPATPEPGDTLAELVSAGIEDFAEQFQRIANRASEAGARADLLESDVEKAKELQSELEASRRETTEAREEISSLRKQVDYLNQLVPRASEDEGSDAEGSAETAPADGGANGKPKPRAKKPKEATVA